VRGRILGAGADGGAISGEDGKRYRFAAIQWRGQHELRGGEDVDYEIGDDGAAIEIFPIGPAPAAIGVLDAPQTKDGTALGVVSLVLGLLGFTPTFGIIAAAAGLFVGRTAFKQAQQAGNSNGLLLARLGIILSCITLVIAALALVALGGIFAGLGALLHHSAGY
jgi:hypothetical protein